MNYLYITSSLEVERESNNPFPEQLYNKSQVANPNVTATQPPRVYDSGTNTIRAATQLEVDGFPAGRNLVRRLQARGDSDEILSLTNSQIGRLIRSVALTFREEINILRSGQSLGSRTKQQVLNRIKSKNSGNEAD